MSNSLINSTTQIDTTLTKDGYAADAKAVGDKFNSILEMEYGCWESKYTVSNKDIKSGTIVFNRPHNSAPKSLVISYRTYNYFYGNLHLDTNISGFGADSTGFYWVYIPIEIGNGLANLLIDWIAIW